MLNQRVCGLLVSFFAIPLGACDRSGSQETVAAVTKEAATEVACEREYYYNFSGTSGETSVTFCASVPDKCDGELGAAVEDCA